KAFDAADSRHSNVHDNGVGILFFEQLEAGLDTIRGVHVIVRFEEHSQAFTRPHFIIDNENLGAFGRGGHNASGRSEARGMPRTGRRSKKSEGKLIKLSRANRYAEIGGTQGAICEKHPRLLQYTLP